MSLLEIQDLRKNFGGVVAVEDFNLQVGEDEIVGLIGPNGAGKTTVFNLITRITPFDRGSIHFAGQDTHRLQPYELTRCGIARTFQNIRLFTGLNVVDNVKVALGMSETRYGLFSALLRLPTVRRQEAVIEGRAQELLAWVGLEAYGHERPEGLPYGLQRRLEIARALANNPRLLLLDEPAAGLNPSEVVDMVELIRNLNREFKLAILLIEHHMDVVMPICERIYVMNFGRRIAVGSPAEVQANPEVLTAYLGQDE